MKRVLCGLLFVALAGCGADAPITAHGKSVAYWAEKTRDPDVKTRLQAVRTLGNAGAKDPAVVPALSAAVKDKHDDVRVEAILALLRLGSDALDAVPALKEARKDANAKVRESAAKALEKIEGS